MTKQQLNRPEILGAAINQRRLYPVQRPRRHQTHAHRFCRRRTRGGCSTRPRRSPPTAPRRKTWRRCHPSRSRARANRHPSRRAASARHYHRSCSASTWSTQPLPKSNASADFLAMLLIVKFIDGPPLYRFEYVLDRHGVTVPRQTLARWIIGAGQLLQPLHNLMRARCSSRPSSTSTRRWFRCLRRRGSSQRRTATPATHSACWRARNTACRRGIPGLPL